MKQLELEQLRKDINAKIDEAIKNLKDFVKGQWYKLNGAYAKYDLSGWGLGFFSNGEFSNRIGMTDTSLWQPVTDFAPLIELLKAEVIKRIGKGKPIGVRDIQPDEWDNCVYWTKNDSDKLGSMWHYVAETDTLYNKGEYNRTIVYENGVFATVAEEENLNHNKEHVTKELIKRGFVKGCSFKFKKDKGIINSSGALDFDHFNEDCNWVVYIDNETVIENGEYATIIEQDKGAKLIEEAKKRGFNGGVYIENIHDKQKAILSDGSFQYCSEKDYLYFGGQMIYEAGIWATIIEEPIMIDGKEVIIRGTMVGINDLVFSRRQIVSLQSLNPIFTKILERMEAVK